MQIRLIDIPLKLYIGDMTWEKQRLQTVGVTIEINVQDKPPDYWAISKGIIREFGKSRHEWLEDLALAMKKYLRKNFKINGRLILDKRPKVSLSPKIFQVTLDI